MPGDSKNLDQAIAYFRNKHESLLAQANKAKEVMEILISEKSNITQSNGTPSHSAIGQENRTLLPKQDTVDIKFPDFVLNLLKDGWPRKTRDIMNAFNARTGKKLERKDCASRLSIMANRKVIRGFKIDTPLPDQKYWWGLNEWFEGVVLKAEYNNRIKYEPPH